MCHVNTLEITVEEEAFEELPVVFGLQNRHRNSQFLLVLAGQLFMDQCS